MGERTRIVTAKAIEVWVYAPWPSWVGWDAVSHPASVCISKGLPGELRQDAVNDGRLARRPKIGELLSSSVLQKRSVFGATLVGSGIPRGFLLCPRTQGAGLRLHLKNQLCSGRSVQRQHGSSWNTDRTGWTPQALWPSSRRQEDPARCSCAYVVFVHGRGSSVRLGPPRHHFARGPMTRASEVGMLT